MGWGCIPDDHPLMAGMVGLQTSHRYGNATFLKSDFVFGIGNRWANRHTGSIEKYTAGRKFVHVDIEPTQIGRVFGPDLGIVSDAHAALELMVEVAEEMRRAWLQLDVTPVDLPRNRADYFAVSYGLAFQFIYDNYIKHDDHFSVFLENDMFPIDFVDIEAYAEPYKVSGDIRFNAAQLPDRMIMFYLGLIIFNHHRMTDKDLFSGLYGHVRCIESGVWHSIDCGGTSYCWLKHNDNYKYCKHIKTIGNDDKDYDPHTKA
jgi:hypothetical protein